MLQKLLIRRIALVLLLLFLVPACQYDPLNTTASTYDNPASHSPESSQGAAWQWAVKATMTMDEAPLDVSLSRDRRWLYVLTDQGNILVWSGSNGFQGRIRVGPEITNIRDGLEDETLLLISRNNRTIELIDIDFVRTIDVSDSPYLGPIGAPVVMVVFSDFQ